MCGQRPRVEAARLVRCLAGKPRRDAAVPINQADADVAVEQAVPVAVFSDQQQPTVEITRRHARPRHTGQQCFDARIEPARPLWAFAHGGKQADAAGIGQRLTRIGGFAEATPMPEQVLAMMLQRVALVLVEVHTGQRAHA
ncbi:hypothetical protein D3C71_1540290 [compost metagenome]